MKNFIKSLNKNRFKIFFTFLILGIIILLFILFANYKINSTTNQYVYSNIDSIPHNKVGLVLGTAKYYKGHSLNPYFTYRMQAAADLYKAGKVEFLVVSGDNAEVSYNEPRDMKNYLVGLGVPSEKIYQDHAGFRTLDSVVRMNVIFGQESFTIISQEFHNRRAIYLARFYGLDAIGYNATDLDRASGFKTNLREKISKTAVFFDLFFGTEPRYLGERIEIK